MATEIAHGQHGESHGDGHATDGHGIHEEHHHITPPKVYLVTFVLLLVLMAATIWASYINLGVFNNIIAMAIAVTKAALVVLFFMQVRYGSRLTWLWAGIGFVWFLLLFGILSDYVSREWIHIQGWQPVAGPH